MDKTEINFSITIDLYEELKNTNCITLFICTNIEVGIILMQISFKLLIYFILLTIVILTWAFEFFRQNVDKIFYNFNYCTI